MGCQNSKGLASGLIVGVPGLLPHHTRKFDKYYEMGTKVGTGAFAHVRLCRHFATGDARVVKIITKPYSYEDFSMEVSLLSKIGRGDCSNVVRFYDYFEDKRFFYSVMEYCRGGDLFSHVASRQGPTTEETVADWMRQILTAVAHIHAQGVVHRDLKPANLLFADDQHSTLKIIDFGLSFPMRKGELLDEPCGTPQFLAPEMILGRYGRKIDIWAIGVLCYMLLFGCRPFVSSNDAELFREIVETEPSFCPRDNTSYDPSISAKDFCRSLLLKDSRKRPTAMDALQHSWIRGKDKFERESSTIPPNILVLAHADTIAIEKRNPSVSELQKSRTGSRLYQRKQTRVNVQQYAELNEHIGRLRACDILVPAWKNNLDNESAEGGTLIDSSLASPRLLKQSAVKETESLQQAQKTVLVIPSTRGRSASDLSSTGNGVSTASSSVTAPALVQLHDESSTIKNSCRSPESQAPSSIISTSAASQAVSLATHHPSSQASLLQDSLTPTLNPQSISPTIASSAPSNGFKAAGEEPSARCEDSCNSGVLDFFHGGWVRTNPHSFSSTASGIVEFERRREL